MEVISNFSSESYFLLSAFRFKLSGKSWSLIAVSCQLSTSLVNPEVFAFAVSELGMFRGRFGNFEKGW